MQVPYHIESSSTGRRLIATEPIARGTVIWRYDSSIPTVKLTLQQFYNLSASEQRMFSIYTWQTRSVEQGADGTPARDEWEGVTSDPDRDHADYFDHSCDPNAVPDGDDIIIAWCDIAAGEPLTLDYATVDTIFAVIPECHCGTLQCRGRVTANDARDPNIVGRYGSYLRKCILAMHKK